jgi:hypothetical protein
MKSPRRLSTPTGLTSERLRTHDAGHRMVPKSRISHAPCASPGTDSALAGGRPGGHGDQPAAGAPGGVDPGADPLAGARPAACGGPASARASTRRHRLLPSQVLLSARADRGRPGERGPARRLPLAGSGGRGGGRRFPADGPEHDAGDEGDRSQDGDRLALALAWPGVLAGAVLSFARGLGEFGATIIVAGRIEGRTETIPLAIYSALEAPGGENRIRGLVLASLGLCVAAVFAARALDDWHRRRLELNR